MLNTILIKFILVQTKEAYPTLCWHVDIMIKFDIRIYW